jgi:hypothetical protein
VAALALLRTGWYRLCVARGSMTTVRIPISVLEWPALVRLFANPKTQAAYGDFYTALIRATLRIDVPLETALGLQKWLLDSAIERGSSSNPADRTDGLHIRDVAHAIEQALAVHAEQAA